MKKSVNNSRTLEYLMDKYGPFLSMDQVCEILGLSRDSVDRKIFTGEIPSGKVGKRRLVSTEDLMNWWNQSVISTQHSVLSGFNSSRLN